MGHANQGGSMTPGERLKTAREAAGYSQEDLAKKIGIVQQSLHKIEAGIIRNPRKMQLIESILGLPNGYLLYGDAAEEGTPTLPQPIIARCPILEWEHAIKWPRNKTEVSKNTDMLTSKILLGSDSYALKVRDESMINHERSFNKDSYIIIDPDREHKAGDLVIAIEEAEELLFRKYVKDGKREYLFAYNPNFDAIKLNESIKICGVVVAHLDVLI